MRPLIESLNMCSPLPPFPFCWNVCLPCRRKPQQCPSLLWVPWTFSNRNWKHSFSQHWAFFLEYWWLVWLLILQFWIYFKQFPMAGSWQLARNGRWVFKRPGGSILSHLKKLTALSMLHLLLSRQKWKCFLGKQYTAEEEERLTNCESSNNYLIGFLTSSDSELSEETVVKFVSSSLMVGKLLSELDLRQKRRIGSGRGRNGVLLPYQNRLVVIGEQEQGWSPCLPSKRLCFL